MSSCSLLCSFHPWVLPLPCVHLRDGETLRLNGRVSPHEGAVSGLGSLEGRGQPGWETRAACCPASTGVGMTFGPWISGPPTRASEPPPTMSRGSFAVNIPEGTSDTSQGSTCQHRATDTGFTTLCVRVVCTLLHAHAFVPGCACVWVGLHTSVWGCSGDEGEGRD